MSRLCLAGAREHGPEQSPESDAIEPPSVDQARRFAANIDKPSKLLRGKEVLSASES